jgi:uncharacterized protein (TIGR04255 family)
MAVLNMQDIRYSKTFLTEVIARIDFLSPVDELQKKLPSKISKQAKRYFPIAEPQSLTGQELQVSPTETRSRRIDATEWVFHGKEREKTFNIGAAAAYVRYTSYTSYELLKQEFLDVMNSSFAVYPDLQGKRIGLRYVNNIDVPNEDPFIWNDLINPQMLGLFSFAPEKQSLSRVFHVLHYNYGDCRLQYQFGMPNPDFPAAIKQPLFVLDLDAHYQGVIEQSDIVANFDKFHEKIQAMFELSITDRLRSLMHE